MRETTNMITNVKKKKNLDKSNNVCVCKQSRQGSECNLIVELLWSEKWEIYSTEKLTKCVCKPDLIIRSWTAVWVTDAAFLANLAKARLANQSQK